MTGKATPDAIDKQVKEIEQLVVSAAGLRKERGDEVKISVVDFVDAGKDLEPAPGPSFVEILEHQTGTLISAGSVLLVAGLLIWFGVRPLTKALLAPPISEMASESAEVDGAGIGEMQSGFPMATMGEMGDGPNMLIQSDDEPDQAIEALIERREKGPQRQLQKLVEFDEEHAAAILRQWIREGASG